MSSSLLIGLGLSQKFPPRLSAGELLFPLNFLFIYLYFCQCSTAQGHAWTRTSDLPPVCDACPQPLTTSLQPTGRQWQPSNRSVDKKITQLRCPASRLRIRRVMICLKYCSSEHWTIPPMVRVNSFWSRRCQFGNRGDLCLILARCNQENNRWLCLTGEPRTCQRNRWKFINNTPDSMPSWGEFFQKKACNPLFHRYKHAYKCKEAFSVIRVVRDLSGKLYCS